jgi:hypothetical protein
LALLSFLAHPLGINLSLLGICAGLDGVGLALARIQLNVFRLAAHLARPLTLFGDVLVVQFLFALPGGHHSQNEHHHNNDSYYDPDPGHCIHGKFNPFNSRKIRPFPLPSLLFSSTPPRPLERS